jgi:drug/metabolite transporter (DMT)-like permease
MAGQDSSVQKSGIHGSALGLALGAALLWGISGAVAADAFAEVSPARAAQARSVVAVVLLVPFARRRGALSVRPPLGLVVMFGVSLAAVHLAYYEAVDRLGVGPGITLQFLGPLLVLGWMRFVERRTVRAAIWGAAAVAVVGTALITRSWAIRAGDLAGVFAGLAAAVSFAAYLVIGEHLGRRMRPSGAMAWGFGIAALLWAFIQPPWSFPTDLSQKVWAELIWLGVLGTAIPFMMELAAIGRASAAPVGVIATAEPVIGTIAAWLLLDQTMEVVQIGGMMLVVVAVAAAQRWGAAAIEVPLDAAR